MSSFFKLNIQDLVKGLAISVIAVVLGALQQMVSKHGFDFSSYDWNAIINLALTTGGAYLTKNLFTDKSGKIFGKI